MAKKNTSVTIPKEVKEYLDTKIAEIMNCLFERENNFICEFQKEFERLDSQFRTAVLKDIPKIKALLSQIHDLHIQEKKVAKMKDLFGKYGE